MKSKPTRGVDLSRNDHSLTSLSQLLQSSKARWHRRVKSVTFSNLNRPLARQARAAFPNTCSSGKRIYGIQVSQRRHESNKNELVRAFIMLLCIVNFQKEKKMAYNLLPNLFYSGMPISVNHITKRGFCRIHFSERYCQTHSKNLHGY